MKKTAFEKFIARWKAGSPASVKVKNFVVGLGYAESIACLVAYRVTCGSPLYKMSENVSWLEEPVYRSTGVYANGLKLSYGEPNSYDINTVHAFVERLGVQTLSRWVRRCEAAGVVFHD